VGCRLDISGGFELQTVSPSTFCKLSSKLCQLTKKGEVIKVFIRTTLVHELNLIVISFLNC